MSEEKTRPNVLSPEEKALREKKKELRKLKERANDLRDTAKAASEERRELLGQIKVMAEELGLGKKAGDTQSAG